MTQNHVEIFFQIVAFLFAISIHESAHAWMASRCGDQTARMLGRVTLNPIKHIDPIGTVVLPILAVISHFPMIGWAKPTPVNPHNFKNYVRDDVMVSIAGPASNFIVVAGSLVVLGLIGVGARTFGGPGSDGVFTPLILMFYSLAQINMLLAIFNLIPLPPLDGSHVLRHALSGGALEVYDRIGMFGLMALVFFGSRILNLLFAPPLGLVDTLAKQLLGY